jgi:hypothetical protein
VPGTLILLLLAIWVGAIAVFVSLDWADNHLWIPVFLAVAGIFGSVLPVAIAPNVALIANAATLVLFILALERLKPRHRRAVISVNHRR